MSSKQPLSAIGVAKPDPRLIGKWRCEKKEGADTHIVRIRFDARGMGHIAALAKNGRWVADPQFPFFFVTRTSKGNYINLKLVDAEHGGTAPGGTYVFLRYSFARRGKTLQIQMLRATPWQNAVSEHRLKGSLEKGQFSGVGPNVLLEDTSEAILSFMEAVPSGQMYMEPVSYLKVR